MGGGVIASPLRDDTTSWFAMTGERKQRSSRPSSLGALQDGNSQHEQHTDNIRYFKMRHMPKTVLHCY